MIISKKTLAIAAAASIAAATPAFSHHSVTQYFDPSKTASVTGTVQEFRFVNPHSILVMKVNNGGQEEIWRAESSPVAWLVRNGWKPSMFKPGQPITIMGNSARDPNVKMLRLLTVKFPDGRTLNANTGEGVK